MRTPRFYIADPLPRTPAAELALRGAVAQHMRVLRLAPGQGLALFDGQGGECAATLLQLGKRDATVRIEAYEAIERESPLHITLVQALATGDKMDAIVQKAVELGAAAVQPISTSRATVKLAAERAAQRQAHWQAVAIAACEQCGRNRVPVIPSVLPFERWLQQPVSGQRLVLHPGGDATLDSVRTDTPVEIAIGPEGGFNDAEIDTARRAGAKLLRAGPRVLRTETAGMALLAALNARAGGLD